MKKSYLLLTGIIALSLSACGATTGSAVKSQAQQKTTQQKTMKQDAVMTMAAPAQIMAAPTTEVEMKPTENASLDCAAISTKMAEAEESMDSSRNVIMGRDTMGEQVGKMALNQGVSRAFKSIPFGGFLAKSAIKSAGNSKEDKAELAKASFNDANLRKAELSGLYAGKNCGT